MELEEVQTLRSLFSDVDPLVVSQLYIQHDKDYRATQQALADLATHPSSAAQQLLPVSTSSQVRVRAPACTHAAPGATGRAHARLGPRAELRARRARGALLFCGVG